MTVSAINYRYFSYRYVKLQKTTVWIHEQNAEYKNSKTFRQQEKFYADQENSRYLEDETDYWHNQWCEEETNVKILTRKIMNELNWK
jgi:hypothetical protein